MSKLSALVRTALAAVLFLGSGQVYSQPAQGGMAEVLRYTGVENPTPADVSRMAELWTTAQDAGITSEQRRAAFRDLYLLYAKLQGQEISAGAVQGIAAFAARTVEGGGRMDLRLPEPRVQAVGSHLHVEKTGRGPVRMLLVSDLGVDGRKLYESFVRRNADLYTMYVVTLPFAGAARPLPWPDKLDFMKRPWLSQIERELLAFVDRPEMRPVVVVGTSAGGYFAARLAVLRPKQVSAAVLVDALVNMPLRSPKAPDSPAALSQRLARVKAVAPTPQLFPYAPVPANEELRRLLDDPNQTHPTARNWMAFAVKDTALSKAWTFDALSTGFFLAGSEYQWEMFTTDLIEDLRSLSVPLLAMGAIHDDGSPRQSPPSLSQWEEIRLSYPQVPLTIVAFEDSRSYISVECPQEFDRAVADFIARRTVQGKQGLTLPRASPRASITQWIGDAAVTIAYGRPAVKGRKVWGELVPNGRVWRAGANEATTFAFNRDVKVQGQALAAGTYTFFVLPAENEWTVIFNRVPRQWGAFNYNPAFDVLRFEVKPGEANHEEYLTYGIEPTGTNSARVTLAWEKLRIAFEMEVIPR